jgi:hypothetical protein
MCNPRRIRIRATRELADAWEQEVRRTVTRQGQAVAEARVSEPLDSSIGGPTLTALVSVLSQTEGWEQDEEGVFRHELAGGYITFDPDSRGLEIVARASAEVRSVGEAVATVHAELSGTVEGEGVGTYYDDGWRRTTRETAQRDAEQNLERSLSEAARFRRDQVRRDTDREAGEEVQARAEREAGARFAAASAARAEELRQRATASLLAVGVEGRAVFHSALAQAYRDAILAYARARHAENIQCRDGGNVLEIEFEMQV